MVCDEIAPAILRMASAEPGFVMQSVPMTVKTHPRRWTVWIAVTVLVLIATPLITRSPAFRDRGAASGVENARLRESRSAPSINSASPGISAEPSSPDPIKESADDSEAALTNELGSAVPIEPFVEYNQIPHYVNPNVSVKTMLPCWALRGSAPQRFVVAADNRVLTSGKTSASIEAVGITSGWGTLHQFASTDGLRGKRVEFSADIRTVAVALRASIFVRADDEKGNAVAFDNMWFNYVGDTPSRLNRSLSGDTEWTTEQIVLDIPSEAAVVSFGATLEGAGKMWIDNAHLEVVGSQTPITAIVRPASMLQRSAVPLIERPPSPRNLDFELAGFNRQCD